MLFLLEWATLGRRWAVIVKQNYEPVYEIICLDLLVRRNNICY
jgi:hypothetical protein